MYYGLSFPKIFSEDDNICHSLVTIYKDFNISFLIKNNRPKLNGIFIYVDNKYIYGLNKRFLHSVSIEDKKYFNSDPCINDLSNVICKTKCKADSDSNIHCISIDDRSVCYYRLARVHWITEVINLANENNSNIKIWSKTFKDKTTGQMTTNRRFVWYKNGLASYVIIFEEKYKNGNIHMLRFLTAYPVFGRRAERDFINDYNYYIK